VKRSPLPPGEPPKRRTPLKRQNAARRAKRFASGFGSVARVEWMQGLPCAACGARPSECAHVRSRGAGGDWRDVVPLCMTCHRLQHEEGVHTFQRRRGLDLRALADRLAGEGPT
jgi:5-methylcytosine-specific restriction endonuclease McrA